MNPLETLTQKLVMKGKMRLFSVVFICCLIVPFQVRAGEPMEAIQSRVNELLNVLNDPSLKGTSASEVKQKKIWSIVDSIFNYTELSKQSLGGNWKRLDPDQQKEFVDLFRRLLGKIPKDCISESKYILKIV